MGRLRSRLAVRLATGCLVAVLAGGWLAVAGGPAVVRAGGGFADLEADATFGVDMTFSASWVGSDPDHVELLLGFGNEDRLVVPVELEGGGLDYRRDMTNDYVPPNTPVAYQWRAVTGDAVTLSAEQHAPLRRRSAGPRWEQAQIGSATVHWYGPNESIARAFGDLAGDAADAAGGPARPPPRRSDRDLRLRRT